MNSTFPGNTLGPAAEFAIFVLDVKAKKGLPRFLHLYAIPYKDAPNKTSTYAVPISEKTAQGGYRRKHDLDQYKDERGLELIRAAASRKQAAKGEPEAA